VIFGKRAVAPVKVTNQLGSPEFIFPACFVPVRVKAGEELFKALLG
jgi:hypothetical protein